MGTIKFRAWDRNSKRMCYRFSMESEFETNIGRFAFMQFTGFTDKNDNEIYVGDIVEYRGHKFQITHEVGSFNLVKDTSDDVDMYELFKGCWNDNVYPMCQYWWNYEEIDGFELRGVEITSNIYENKISKVRG